MSRIRDQKSSVKWEGDAQLYGVGDTQMCQRHGHI